jgi:hypothetical protein
MCYNIAILKALEKIQMDLNYLKERFLTFAETECKGNSELYYKLSIEIANDSDLLNIAATTRQGQPIPNIFFAAIHYLLLVNPNEELARFYPSIQKKYFAEIPFYLFKAFCIKNENEVKKIISTKIVQTNVINRCAYLMPIFSEIISQENKPTTLIDIGTSAGLTLNFDKYEYWYDNKKVYGQSKVMVKSKIVGLVVPTIYNIFQPIIKIGLDQNLIDPTDKDEILWLKALIWTDQLERFIAIEEALKLDELKNIKFIKAKQVSDFEREILMTNKNQALIIYATHVLYQFPHSQKDEFYSMLDRIGQVRDFYFLSVESIKPLLEKYNSIETVIELTKYKNKHKTVTFIAETNGHGNWLKWR